MQYSTYWRPCSTSNLSLNRLSFFPAASLVWSQGLTAELSPLVCTRCFAKYRTTSGSLLPPGPFCQTYQLHLHLALLLYKHLQQQITAGFYKRLLTKTDMEQVWREKEVSKERQDKSSRNSFLPVQIPCLWAAARKHQLFHACNKKI